MNPKMFKGYVLSILGGAVLIAAAMLVLFNWGPQVEVRLFWASYSNVSLGLTMLISAVVGVCMYFTTRWMISGIWALFKGRRRQEQVRREARSQRRREEKASERNISEPAEKERPSEAAGGKPS